MKYFFFLFLLSLPCQAEVKQLKCEVISEMTRSKKGFTQGFFILDGKLYESTGGYGSSLVRRFDLKTQEVELSKPLPGNIFGEGLTPFGENEMIQVTWKKGLGIVYDREQINVKKTFRYGTEGWGITSKGDSLVMSDGTSKLFFLHPETFQVVKELNVTMDGGAVEKLNELEWVGEHIYANVWMTDEIVKIHAESGKVEAVIDCSHIYPERPQDESAVLNGIAYDFTQKCFYITGKKWGKIFQVQFIDKAAPTSVSPVESPSRPTSRVK